jgi:transposase InsO family protein
MNYNQPGPPTARAHRRQADLQRQQYYNRQKIRRQDRRRAAFATMKYRLRIVKDYQARRLTCRSEAEAAEQTAARFGYSMRSVRRFAREYRIGGKRGLLPQYRQQSHSASPLTAVTSIIIALRVHLGWCAQRIAAELKQRQIATISQMSVYRLLRRYHLPRRSYHPVARRDGINYQRQQVTAPNILWQIDFAGPWSDTQQQSRSLLVVVDSYSRMLLALEVVEHQNTQSVEDLLSRLFARYGTPRCLLSDNGRAFAPSCEGWSHRFTRFLACHGVEHRRTAPYYPQSNGKAEAAIKIIKREFLDRLGYRSQRHWQWADVIAQCAAFQGWYNFYRAHGALGYATPAQRYAGIMLPKSGLEAIFGLQAIIAEATILPENLPVITQSNRTDRLALMLM